MKSFENERGADIESREVIEERAFELLETVMKSLDYIEEKLRFIRRYAEKIDDSSTRIFIGSFQNNFDDIRSAYEPVKSFYGNISKLSMEGQKTDIDKMDRGSFYGNIETETESDKKDEGGGEKLVKANPLAEIKWELENSTKNLPAKIEFTKDAIRLFRRSNNDLSFIDDAFSNLESLDDAMGKLFEVEKKIAEYSKQ